ncbi:MAG: exonuclease SbcCD subunit D [Eubacteriaceae bacterium]|nr:exonuclease SbcCD subunit D [Eubacteriaceae bacterium]
MKLLHTSDWHLGMSDGEKSLYDDQVHFINDICRISVDNDVDAVIIAGDIFDRSVPSADAVKLYDMAMTRLCVECGKDVIAIAGNHDSADRVESCNRLLSKAGLHVLGAVSAEPEVVSYDDADIYMLPWVKENKVKSLFPEEADNIKSLEDAYGVLCHNMRTKFKPGKKNILVSHSFLTNSETSQSDRAAVLGYADQVGASVFDDFDYVALGHIHKPQDIGQKARYSGTPMAYSFGAEEKQEKSVTIIDTATMERTIVPLKPLHKRITVTGTLQEILENQYSQDVLDGYTRIVVTDMYVGLDALSKISARFKNFVEVSGKSFEDKESTIRLTMEELKELESNPMEIFRNFYRDVMEGEPDDRVMKMFSQCVEEYDEEVQG